MASRTKDSIARVVADLRRNARKQGGEQARFLASIADRLDALTASPLAARASARAQDKLLANLLAENIHLS